MTTDLEARYSELIDQPEVPWDSNRHLERCLGGGGQGTVYLSRRRGSGDFSLPVALKFFSPQPYDSPQNYRDEMARMARVASQVASIQHDNLVDVQNFVELNGIFVLEMEWVDGADMRCLLTPDALQHVREHATQRRWQKLNRDVVTDGRAQPRVKPGMAIAILRECLSGLAALHRQGIVHNDLKPSNIMLKRSGNVKLIDIGSGFATSETPLTVPCTPEYAAPEVLDGHVATPRSDLASLGYVLLEMLSGAHPFGGLSYARLVRAKQSALDQLPAWLPPEEFAYADMLLPLLRRLIAPDPSQRFESAEQADQSDDGALAFEEELIKGDLAFAQETDIRAWMKEVEANPETSDEMDSTRTFSRPTPQHGAAK